MRAELSAMQPSHVPPRFTSTPRTWGRDRKDPSPETFQRTWACQHLEFSPASRAERGYISVGVSCPNLWCSVPTIPGTQVGKGGGAKVAAQDQP